MKPKKLFISYPSESWNFAQRIAENLAPRLEQSIFIDYRSIDQADFAESILKHLRESDAVILVITNFTFEDIHHDNDWVRLEIRTALENQIPIVLVRENGLLPPKDLPDDVRDVVRSQGVPFYREFFEPGVVMLAEFLIRINVATARTTGTAEPIIQPTPPPERQPEPEPQRVIAGQGSIEEAIDLIEVGDFDKALVILETLRERSGLRPVAARLVDDLVVQAQTMRENAARRREAELDYETIAAMAGRKITEASARAAFAEWCQTYSDLVEELDTADLNSQFAATESRYRGLIKGVRASLSVLSVLPQPFEWIDIPGAKGKTWKGEPYRIAKYPVTNAQFAKFITASGYQEPKWWTKAGWEARILGYGWDDKQSIWVETNTSWIEPRFWRDSKWNGAEQPVVGVSWYEAVAFCLWLSEVTGENIMLPTEDQWQYAAQGDDEREYPWGNEWDCSRCNNSVKPCDSSVTTPVRQYEGKGESPFGVVDMSGNVWEWCLTDYENGTNEINSNAEYRVLCGGSWWNNDTDAFRCDTRDRHCPQDGIKKSGFRLALS